MLFRSKAGFISALYIIFVPIIAVLQGHKLEKRIVFSVILAVIGLYFLCYTPIKNVKLIVCKPDSEQIFHGREASV